MSRDVRAEFARATALHREGRLDAAVDIYRRLLKAHPGAFEIQSLLVFAQLQAGRQKEALATARKAREAHPSNPHAHIMLGAAHQAAARHDRALAAFEAAAVLQPGLSEAHYLAGNALAALGRLSEAVARFDRALALDPLGIEPLTNRATALTKLGRPDEALADCERLVKMQPWDAQHHLAKAGTLLELGRFADASAAADAALAISPDLADAHYLKAQALAAQSDLEGAGAEYGKAATLAPDRENFAVARARLERQLGHHGEASALLDEVLVHDAAAPFALQERAEVKRESGDLEGALADVELALAADPTFAAALTTKARLMADLGRPQEIRPLVDAALAADPIFPMARNLRAMEDLAAGCWTEGWEGYESRADLLPPPYRPLPFARWEGGTAPEELIVLAEQGIGDQIQFGRLLRVLADRGISARLLASERNAPLLALIDARVPVVKDLSDVDTARPGVMWAPLASLPRLVLPDPADWPRPPYLTADPKRVGRWRPMAEGVFRIGIAWQGNPSPTVDVGRSVPLEMFAPLAALAGVELVSLQKGVGAEQVAHVHFRDRIVDPAAQLDGELDADGTFLDTSGLLHHLDLVVTTDTSLAHLAGARGRPTFVALRKVPDWRWGRSGQDSPLYPSLRLFRQERAGDWAGVFEKIVGAVKVVVSEQGHDEGPRGR